MDVFTKYCVTSVNPLPCDVQLLTPLLGDATLLTPFPVRSHLLTLVSTAITDTTASHRTCTLLVPLCSSIVPGS